VRGVAIIAALALLVAGCGDEKKSDLETKLENDVKARQLEPMNVSCDGKAPKFECKVTFADKSEAEYDAVECGSTYDARARPPIYPNARGFHFGGDCEAAKYVPQSQLALAVVRTKSKAECKKYWGKGLAADCRVYLEQASPNSNARVDFVQPRLDGAVDVNLFDPEGPRGLAVRVKEKDGKPVVAGLVNFPPP
jgi:hypothetical protein